MQSSKDNNLKQKHTHKLNYLIPGSSRRLGVRAIKYLAKKQLT